MRLDRAVAARGLARSRTHAHELIGRGDVLVNGRAETRPARDVTDADDVTLASAPDPYVSRAAHKLISALDAFGPEGLEVAGRRCVDAGASTGGFTQVLRERGAAHVLALDVGHGQLDPRVAADPGVTSREGVNVRDLVKPTTEGDLVDLVVADLSFISLTLVVAPLTAQLRPGGDALLMVKPQFEAGQAALDKDGVVRSPQVRAHAIRAVAAEMAACGLDIRGVRRSALSGPSGNVEFFVWGSLSWQAGPRDVPPWLEGAIDLEAKGETA